MALPSPDPLSLTRQPLRRFVARSDFASIGTSPNAANIRLWRAKKRPPLDNFRGRGGCMRNPARLVSATSTQSLFLLKAVVYLDTNARPPSL